MEVLAPSIECTGSPIAEEAVSNGSTPAAHEASARWPTCGESFTASVITSAINNTTTRTATPTAIICARVRLGFGPMVRRLNTVIASHLVAEDATVDPIRASHELHERHSETC